MYRRIVVPVLALALLPAVTHAAPAAKGFPLKAWVSPSSMSHSAYPTLYAKTASGAVCAASVSYDTGRPPRSFNGSAQRAGGNGQVSWSWHEETRGSGGTAEVDCTYRGQSKSATASFSVG